MERNSTAVSGWVQRLVSQGQFWWVVKDEYVDKDLIHFEEPYGEYATLIIAHINIRTSFR
ncbi:hypothetical protein [Rubritalea tangerina]|uniref:hypothetical protein n=1 Tax=Rubritalea tangerina TaxID=430798 RepID=UPI0036243490